jgi:hypothetical protein
MPTRERTANSSDCPGTQDAPTPVDDRSSRREGAALAVLLALTYCLYVSSTYGLISSNDGSHFATTRALVERGGFRIGDGFVFALNDVSVHDGKRYSSKPPGTGILAVPLYGVAKLAHDWLQSPPEEAEGVWLDVLLRVAREFEYDVSPAAFRAVHVASRPEQAMTALLASMAGTLGLWMFYRCSRRLGASWPASLVGLLALALGSVYWRYSTALFAHVISAALLMLQFEWLVSGRAWRSRATAFSWGVLVGAAVVVEYQAVLSAPLLLLAWVGCGPASKPSQARVQRFFPVALGIALPLAGLAWNQYSCFGSPWTTAQFATEHYEYTRSATGMLAGNLLDGTYSMLFSAEARGLLRVSPIVILAAVGWLFWPASRRRLQVAALAIVFVHCAVLFQITAPEGGATGDHRYLVRILPLVFLPLGLVLDRLRRTHAVVFFAGCVIAGQLFAASVARNYAIVAGFMKHALLLPAPSIPLHGSWQQLSSLNDAVFPSAGNWPLLVLAGVVYLPASLLAWWVLGREGPRGDRRTRWLC